MRPVSDLASMVSDMQDLIRVLPTWVGREAVNFYKDSWRRQGYINNKVEKWAARKTEGKWGQKAKKGKIKSRALLVQTGDLRRSIRFQVSGNNIRVWTDVPYAQAHNEGLQVTTTQTVGSHQRRAHIRNGKPIKATTVKTHTRKMDFKMPKRQFMDIPNGKISPFLEKRFVLHIQRALESFKK